MELDGGQAGAWMDRALAGDDRAFERFARAVQNPLYRFALAQGLRRCEADEAAQETLLRAYRGRKAWRAGGDAVAWVYGIAMNVVREMRRKARRQASIGIDPAVLPATTPDGPASAERRCDLQRLQRAIAGLPDRQREAVACRFLRRMSVTETAAAMGCAEGTVKAATFAAMRNLRNAMGADAG